MRGLCWDEFPAQAPPAQNEVVRDVGRPVAPVISHVLSTVAAVGEAKDGSDFGSEGGRDKVRKIQNLRLKFILISQNHSFSNLPA